MRRCAMSWLEASRAPVETYEQAVYTLLGTFDAYSWIFDDDKPMPPEARIVADIYWINEKKLRLDLQRCWGAP